MLAVPCDLSLKVGATGTGGLKAGARIPYRQMPVAMTLPVLAMRLSSDAPRDRLLYERSAALRTIHGADSQRKLPR